MALGSIQLASSQPDHELVAEVRHGSDSAFAELYARYNGRIRAYVLGMVSDRDRAEDVTQEVFIAALRRLRKTGSEIAFKPWIYEIARNACIDEFRRNRRSQEVPLEMDEQDGSVERPLSAPPVTEVETAVEGKQRLADLRGAFHGLSKNHHRLIVLRELEGRSYGEIAERMGMSHPAVESTLFRARRRLREEYEELVSGRRCEQVQGLFGEGDTRKLRSLAGKQRRQVARHISHCQPCRFAARSAGVKDADLKTPGVIGKVAALLPIPWLRLRGTSGPYGSPHFAGLTRKLHWLTSTLDPSSAELGMGRVVAAAATIAAVGIGGGLIAGSPSGSVHRSHLQRVRLIPVSATLSSPAQAISPLPPSNTWTSSAVSAARSASSTSHHRGAASAGSAGRTRGGGARGEGRGGAVSQDGGLAGSSAGSPSASAGPPVPLSLGGLGGLNGGGGGTGSVTSSLPTLPSLPSQPTLPGSLSSAPNPLGPLPPVPSGSSLPQPPGPAGAISSLARHS